jgi:hypothetical protein
MLLPRGLLMAVESLNGKRAEVAFFLQKPLELRRRQMARAMRRA